MSDTRYSPSEGKARRHIEISLRVKRIVQSCCPADTVYVATYTAGGSGQNYQRIEEESGEDFWSIKAYEKPPRADNRIKDLDVVVARQGWVRFAIEVKWGAIPGSSATDLETGSSGEERAKLRRLFCGPVVCRVRGPAVMAGRRYRSREFSTTLDYRFVDETRVILVTDVAQMQATWADCRRVLRPWRDADPRILLADISTPVEDVPALRELLCR